MLWTCGIYEARNTDTYAGGTVVEADTEAEALAKARSHVEGDGRYVVRYARPLNTLLKRQED